MCNTYNLNIFIDGKKYYFNKLSHIQLMANGLEWSIKIVLKIIRSGIVICKTTLDVMKINIFYGKLLKSLFNFIIFTM